MDRIQHELDSSNYTFLTHIRLHSIADLLRYSFIALMLHVSLFSVSAQIPITWSQNLGNAQKNIIVDIVDIPGSGCLTIGYSKEAANEALSFWANRLDNNGVLLWSKHLGSTGFDRATAAVLLDDGNFIIVGHGNVSDGDFDGGSKRSDGIVVNMDTNGNINWTRAYGEVGHDQFADVLALPNGAILAVGTTTSYTNNSFAERASDGWAVRINASGGVVWNRRFGGSLMDGYNKAILNPDGSFLLGGSSNSRDGQSANSFGANDLWLSIINADGTHAWSRNYGGDLNDQLNDIVPTSDGGYVLGATTFSAMSGSKGHGDMWVLKVSALGNQLWQNILGGTSTDKTTSLAPFEGDGFLIAGTTMSTDGDISNPLGGLDSWIAKLSSTGNVEWKDNLGGAQNDAINVIQAQADGSFWLAGYSFSSDNDLSANMGMQDGWVIRSDNTPPPSISLGGNQEICVGAEVTLDATDPNCPTCQYQWNDGNMQAIRTIVVTTSATFSVTLTNSAGAMFSDAVTITAIDPINATETIERVKCADDMNGSISLQVSGGTQDYTYSWSSGQVTKDIMDLGPGTYFVTISDDALCEFVDSYTLTNPAPIVLTADIVLPSCTSANLGSISIVANGGAPPYDYMWDNGLIGPIITGLDPGQYEVTVTDTRSCEHVETFEVSNDAIINVDLDLENVTCYDGSDGTIDIDVTGDFPPFSFSWDNGFSSNSLVGLTAGDYTVTITDAMDCQLVEKYTITEPAELQVVAVQNNTQSNAATGSILLDIVGGVPDYDVVWSNGQTGILIEDLDIGLYQAVITDANGCILIMDYEITIQTSTTSPRVSPLEVFPNPSLGLVYIQLPDALSGEYTMGLFDIHGRAVSFQSGPSAISQVFLEVDRFTPGLYLLSITDNQQTYQAKIILQ